MTGWTNAVVPAATWGITTLGRSITSKFVPPFSILILDNGP